MEGSTVLARYALDEAVEQEIVSELVSEDLLPSGAPWRLLASEVVELPADCAGSYMSHDAAESRLWVGDFSTSSGADLCIFPTRADGSLGPMESHWVLPIEKVQGILALGDGRALLSQSYSTADSALYLWTPGDSSVTQVLSGPSGFEDLTLSPEGLIWTSSESGGRFYQKRFTENPLCGTNWGDLYPYAFALDPESFIPD